MSKLYLLEIEAGYRLRRWTATATAGVYSHEVDRDADIASIKVDGVTYAEQTSLANCNSTASSWFLSRGSTITTLYVHIVSDGNANSKFIKVGMLWHLSRQSIIVPKSVTSGVESFYYEGRLRGIPSISYHPPHDSIGGGIIRSIGGIILSNHDGYYDSLVSRTILKNQPIRLYEGTIGGTMTAGFIMKQLAFIEESSVNREQLSLKLLASSDILKKPINSGSNFGTYIPRLLGRGEPNHDGKGIPVVFGPMEGIPAYYLGGVGLGTGTFQVACHPIGTVQKAMDSDGTVYTISDEDHANGKFVIKSSGVVPYIAFVRGTGYKVNGTVPMKAGEIMQYILGSFAGVGSADIATSSFSKIDTDRSILMSCWMGRGETIEQAMDYISRSEFSSWNTQRNGIYQVQLKGDSLPGSIAITNGGFESGTNKYSDDSPYELFGTALSSRVSNDKMILYNNSMLTHDGGAGSAIYRGSTYFYNGTLSTVRITVRMKNQSGDTNLHSGTIKILNRYDGSAGSYTAYELVLPIDESDPRKLTLNRRKTGEAAATMGTGSVAFGLGGTLRQIDLEVDAGAGVSTINAKVNGVTQITVADGAGDEIAGSGYAGILLHSAKGGAQIGTMGWSYQLGTYLDYIDGSYGTSSWTAGSSALQRGTTPGHFAYAGTVVGHLLKVAGTDGTLARIYQGGYGATSGTDYLLTAVAALQSGTLDNFCLSYQDASGTEHFSGTVALASGTYRRAFCHFRPNSTGLGTISIYPGYLGTTTGTCWIDDVRLYPVKMIHSWQLKGFEVVVLPALHNQISSRSTTTGNEGVGDIVHLELPPVPFSSSREASGYVYVTAHGTWGSNADYLSGGMSERVIEGCAWGTTDAQTIAEAALQYYSKPKYLWKAEFLDYEGETINIMDLLYVQDGRMPGLPDENRLLLVNEMEDIHPGNGPARLRLAGEVSFDPTHDQMMA